MKQWDGCKASGRKDAMRVMTNANDVISRRQWTTIEMNVLCDSAERSFRKFDILSHIFVRKKFAGLKSFGDFDQHYHARLKKD